VTAGKRTTVPTQSRIETHRLEIETSFTRSGVASVNDLATAEWQAILQDLEGAQAEFLSQISHSREYQWPRDPLHTWSRVWEYPYVLHHLCRLRCELAGDRVPTAVDFGSGVTFFPFVVSQKGFRVICVDNDPVCQRDLQHAIEKMRSGVNVQFLLSHGDSIPVPDSSVDVVYSVSVLEHLPDPAAALAEFARILVPGGLLLMTFDLDLVPGSETGIGADRYDELLTRLKEHFVCHLPPKSIDHPARVLTSRSGPFPIERERQGLSAVWWVLKQQLLKPLLGRKPFVAPYLGCGAVVARRHHGAAPG
jgi:SAM-dependent methyltransferase